MESEKSISELKKRVKESDTQREEALSQQTELSIQMQSLKITVRLPSFHNSDYLHAE